MYIYIYIYIYIYMYIYIYKICHSLSNPRSFKKPSNSIRRSAVDREDLKPYWKLEKKPIFRDNLTNH